MGSIVVLAAVIWLFLLVLVVAILRTAAQPATRRRAVGAAALVAAVPLAGATLGAADADAASCRTARAAARMSAPRATLCLINRRRRAHGLGRLRGSRRLRRAAHRHAADMVRHGYFEHTSLAGETFTARLRSVGYTRGCSSWAGGETLAWGLGSRSSPWSRVAAWMHSPPHRAILLTPGFRQVGIAVLRGTPGFGPRGFTYVAEFGRRRC